MKAVLATGFIAILCLSMFSASASNGLAQRSSVDWPMFRHDSAHSGVGTGSPVLAPTLLWKYTTGGPVDSSPAVVNGVVYVGCYDGSLYALNSATGAKIWIEGASGDPLISSPAVVGGSVYVGGAGEIIAKTAASGVQVMGATSTASLYGSLVDSSPAVVDGIVYYGTYDGGVYALNASRGNIGGGGQFVWTYSVGKYVQVNSSPAVFNGVVYIGAEYAYANQTSVEGVGEINAANGIYAINATDGEMLWNFTDGGYSVDSSPAVVNGVVYVGSYDGDVYALDAANGAKLWNFTTGAYVDSSPAVTNGVVYISSHDGNFYAFNATNGLKLWSYPTNGGRSSPAVVNGVVYVGGGNSLYALNATIGAKLWNYTTSGDVESSPAVANGVVYVGSDDGNIYAIGTSSTSSNALSTLIEGIAAVIIVAVVVFLTFRKRSKTS